MSTNTLNAQVIVNGVDVTASVVSIKRDAHACQVGMTATIDMSPDWDPTPYAPWNTLVISEMGTLVMTGYVSEFKRERGPATLQMGGVDTFQRCVATFIDHSLLTMGETVAYWVDTLCTMSGVAYAPLPAWGAAQLTAAETEFGYRTAAEGLTALCNLAGWVMRVQPAGTLEFLDFINGGSQPTHSISQVMGGTMSLSDKDTRTQVAIWGDEYALGGQVMFHATRHIPGISPERKMLVANPQISTNDQAATIGNRLLDYFAVLTTESKISVVGDPAIRPGDLGVQSSFVDMGYPLQRASVIQFASDLSDKGYSQDLSMGMRCIFPFPPQAPLKVKGIIVLDETGRMFYTLNPLTGATWVENSGSLSGKPLRSFGFDEVHGNRLWATSEETLWQNDGFFTGRPWGVCDTALSLAYSAGWSTGSLACVAVDQTTTGRLCVAVARATGPNYDMFLSGSENGGSTFFRGVTGQNGYHGTGTELYSALKYGRDGSLLFGFDSINGYPSVLPGYYKNIWLSAGNGIDFEPVAFVNGQVPIFSLVRSYFGSSVVAWKGGPPEGVHGITWSPNVTQWIAANGPLSSNRPQQYGITESLIAYYALGTTVQRLRLTGVGEAYFPGETFLTSFKPVPISTWIAIGTPVDDYFAFAAGAGVIYTNDAFTTSVDITNNLTAMLGTVNLRQMLVIYASQ